ncbi:hypothetical protein HID58_076963 [Brassica napus]|uniref:RNase H type-1 domain-containing protein n=1 Tax=Brassica napus TaxID=3708 RepID=A0ABQ7YP40_BRANA|nr:hypothetical protein HID58_076963 [Brassica napus]
MRVQINGLQPLVMRMDIELPSKEVVEVELEYEKLKKHCFRCKSLSHEEDDCDINPPRHHYEGDRRTNNISQQNTLERIAEGKQRQADRKQSRLQQRPYNTGARWPNYKETNSRGNRDSYREAISKNPSENSSGYEENRRRYDDRYEERNKQISRTPVYVRRSPTIRGSQGPASAINSNQARSLNGNEKNRTPPSREASSVSKSSPPANLALVPQRNSLVSRLSDPKSLSVASAERQSAKERLSVQTQRLSTSDLRDSLSGSKRQDREPHNGEDEPTKEINNFTITRPSSSSIFDSNRLGPGDRSPIRTLSDDRVHVSLRLGTLISETESGDSEPSDLPTLTKAEGKRTMLRSQSKKRGPRSPLQGTSVKKRRVTKIRESPRRKLMMDAITAGGHARAWNAAQNHVEKHSLPRSVVPYISNPVANSYTWSIYSDAAWEASTGNCGLGWYLRDASGTAIESSSSHRRFVTSALVAEALAVKAAITAARSSFVSCLNVFSDSKALILLLKSQDQNVVLKGILHDIRILALSFESISYYFVPRLANLEADHLAKSALYSLSLDALASV